MTRGALEIEEPSGARRVELAPGLTRVGGAGAEVRVEGVGSDQLHVWDDPPRAVFVGRGAAPTLNGRPLDEAPLRSGDRIAWGRVRLVFRTSEASLEELPVAAPAPAAAPVAFEGAEERLLRRLQAGLLLDLGLADRSVARRWQEAVLAERFEPDACAREVLATSTAHPDDLRLEGRAGRLLRDFLMAPLVKGVRGGGRRARQAVRGGIAFLVAQGFALLVYSLLVLAALVLLRLRNVSVDHLLDRILLR